MGKVLYDPLWRPHLAVDMAREGKSPAASRPHSGARLGTKDCGKLLCVKGLRLACEAPSATIYIPSRRLRVWMLFLGVSH